MPGRLNSTYDRVTETFGTNFTLKLMTCYLPLVVRDKLLQSTQTCQTLWGSLSDFTSAPSCQAGRPCPGRRWISFATSSRTGGGMQTEANGAPQKRSADGGKNLPTGEVAKARSGQGQGSRTAAAPPGAKIRDFFGAVHRGPGLQFANDGAAQGHSASGRQTGGSAKPGPAGQGVPDSSEDAGTGVHPARHVQDQRNLEGGQSHIQPMKPRKSSRLCRSTSEPRQTILPWLCGLLQTWSGLHLMKQSCKLVSSAAGGGPNPPELSWR